MVTRKVLGLPKLRKVKERVLPCERLLFYGKTGAIR